MKTEKDYRCAVWQIITSTQLWHQKASSTRPYSIQGNIINNWSKSELDPHIMWKQIVLGIVIVIIKVLPNLWEWQLPLHQLEQRKRYRGLLLHQVFKIQNTNTTQNTRTKYKPKTQNRKHKVHQLEQRKRYRGMLLYQVFFSSLTKTTVTKLHGNQPILNIFNPIS